MQKLFFLINSSGESVFGAQTEKHGQLPAFFTDGSVASTFFASKVKDQDKHVFGSSDDADEIRKFLAWNEKSYVLLDGVAMTGAEMLKALKK